MKACLLFYRLKGEYIPAQGEALGWGVSEK
jgi:hypothetical protein